MSTADKLNKVLETKEAIKQAIIDKGGTVGDVFADYPTAIQNLQGGGGSGTFVVPKEMRFAYSKFTKFPDNWDWSEVEKESDLNHLFYSNKTLEVAPQLQISPTNITYMFSDCNKLQEIDVSKWDTSNITSFSNVFGSCMALRRINGILNTSKATTIESMFTSCNNIDNLQEFYVPLAKATASYNSPLNSCYVLRNFGGFKGLSKTIYLTSAYSLSYTSLLNIINGLADGVSGQTLYLSQDCVNQLSDDDIAIATNKGWAISPAKTITEPIVVTDLSQIPTSTYQITPKTYDFSQFDGAWGNTNPASNIPCKQNIRSFEADLSSTTDMSYILYSCQNLSYCKLTGTSNVTDMSNVFNYYGSSDFTFDASEFDTSNATTMYRMFCSSAGKGLNVIGISSWNVSNVTNMERMFESRIMDSLDLSRWTYASGVSMKDMFKHSTIKSIHLGDISNVENMLGLFELCTELESVTMLGKPSSNLETIYMFLGVKPNGVLYYDSQYDYSKIIAQLPSTWTAVPLTE